MNELVYVLTCSSLGLTNSSACRLMACKAASGAYPGCGGGGAGAGISVLPLCDNCLRLAAIIFII